MNNKGIMISAPKKSIYSVLSVMEGAGLEVVDITVKIITDRAIANELVRHRIAVYNQKSSRYVDEKELEVIEPLNESTRMTILFKSAILF